MWGRGVCNGGCILWCVDKKSFQAFVSVCWLNFVHLPYRGFKVYGMRMHMLVESIITWMAIRCSIYRSGEVTTLSS